MAERSARVVAPTPAGPACWSPAGGAASRRRGGRRARQRAGCVRRSAPRAAVHDTLREARGRRHAPGHPRALAVCAAAGPHRMPYAATKVTGGNTPRRRSEFHGCGRAHPPLPPPSAPASASVATASAAAAEAAAVRLVAAAHCGRDAARAAAGRTGWPAAGGRWPEARSPRPPRPEARGQWPETEAAITGIRTATAAVPVPRECRRESRPGRRQLRQAEQWVRRAASLRSGRLCRERCRDPAHEAARMPSARHAGLPIAV